MSRSIQGYAALFNRVDMAGDVIAPGAFADTLADTRAGDKTLPAMLYSMMRRDPSGAGPPCARPRKACSRGRIGRSRSTVRELRP